MAHSGRCRLSRILITGADGYLGRAITRALLEHAEHELILWCHARDEATTRRKRSELLSLQGIEDRASWVNGDLGDQDPFAGIDAADITHIVHTAGVVRFNVDHDQALQINVEGTRRLAQFARQCPRLQHLLLLGSLYSVGTTEGTITEDPLPAPIGFANDYEWSKHEAEQLLAGPYPDLPASVLRVGTVIADDETGVVSEFNVIHNCLRLFFYGLLTVLPGDAETPVYVVTRSLIAQTTATILLQSPPGHTYHLVPDATGLLTLGQMLDVVYDAFGQDPEFRQARILRPLLSNQQAFDALCESVGRFGGPVLQEAVASIRPFAPQLFSRKHFRNTRMRSVIGPWGDPDGQTLMRNTAGFLARTRWGMRDHYPVPRGRL